MDRSTFWKLISRIDRSALRDGDEEGAVEPLVEALSEQGEQEIRSFEDHLSQVLYDLDGESFANEAGDSGQSGDGFLYARCFVVACGQKNYEAVKTDPAKMSKSIEDWCESLLYVASCAWAQATGNDEEEWDHIAPVSYETGSNQSLWK
jgi:hypothetical protein